MKKTFFIIFLSVFLLLSLLPFAGLLLTGPSGASANEILADPPQLKTQEGKLNFELLNDTCDWLADRFSGRQELITAEAAIEAAVFRESASEDVILGKDGWLYYKTTLDDYQGQNLLTDRQIWSAAHCLKLIQQTAQARGIRFLFTVVPNKNTLYPEQMPARYLRSTEPGNLEHLAQALDDACVSYLDLLGVLRAEDAVLYQKTDSHWNNLGAALAHDALTRALGADAEKSYLPQQFTARADHEGDLYRMLYPAGSSMDVQYYPEREWRFTYDRPIRSAEDQMIFTSCEGKAGSLLMFRDSFGNTLHPFMAESFGTAVFSRAMPYDLSLLDMQSCDTLLIEIVQRNIPWLCERAPVMQAPVVSLDIPQTETATDATCRFTQTGETVFCYTGNLPQTDTDSPVYLLCDGTLYEASPAGEGENPYTAYLPVQAQTVQLLFTQGGQLVISQPIACER